MRQNRVKALWREGETVLNGWLHIPSSFSAEVMAHAGMDSLTVDLQHGPTDYQAAISMLQAVSTTDVVPLARVPWNEPGIIMKLLDGGCYGIICPMINTREDAERFVGACRYPPDGYRSFGPYRARIYGGADYAEHANDEIITMAMIETREALDNLDEILAVPGLDAVFVGPSDLGQSLGTGPRLDPEEPKLVDAIDRILSSARERDLEAGIFTGSAEYAAQMVEKGFRFVTVLSDARYMAAGAAEVVSALKDGGMNER